jgi:pyruvate dehydrogenase E1 component beta subunit
MFFAEAIARALHEEMARDERIIVLGQDVGAFGGSYAEFAGLLQAFGAKRVRDMPVAEASIVGVGAGAAAAGLRPLVGVTYMDFLMLGLDPLVNYAAKLRFKTGGQLRAPLVVKTTAGAKGQGVAHSQCLEAWVMSVPGLKVVAPATAGDAYGLMKSALREDGPVVYVDHKRLFPVVGDVTQDECVPIGKAAIRRRGSDVTIAAHSYMCRIADKAVEQLAAEGIHGEVVDLRTLAPLDLHTLCESAGRTRALLTLEEGQLACGVGAEVAFRVRAEIDGLRVARLGAQPAPVAPSPVLEAACLPDAQRVCEAVRRLLSAHSARVAEGTKA